MQNIDNGLDLPAEDVDQAYVIAMLAVALIYEDGRKPKEGKTAITRWSNNKKIRFVHKRRARGHLQSKKFGRPSVKTKRLGHDGEISIYCPNKVFRFLVLANGTEVIKKYVRGDWEGEVFSLAAPIFNKVDPDIERDEVYPKINGGKDV